jgi:hypothetical protein
MREKDEKVPSSTPYCNSKGLPVSLHIGKGTYCNSFFSFEICSPVSLFAANQHEYVQSSSILKSARLTLEDHTADEGMTRALSPPIIHSKPSRLPKRSKPKHLH